MPSPMDIDEELVDTIVRLLPKYATVPYLGEGSSVEDLAEILEMVVPHWAMKIPGTAARKREEYQTMVRDDAAFAQAIQTACITRKFKSVYNSYQKKTSSPSPRFSSLAARSFRMPYRGTAAIALKEYMRESNQLFNSTPRWMSPFYAKFFSIVQSSGTGKTRMINELSNNGVLVVYICLREPSDTDKFPPRDDVPAKILLQSRSSDDDYLRACYFFLAALFTTIEEQLSSSAVKMTSQEWNNQFGTDTSPNQRSDFFVSLFHHFKQLENITIDSSPQNYPDGGERQDRYPIGKTVKDTVHARFRVLSQALKAHFPVEDHDPQIVIAFDEAHTLESEHYGGHRPLHYLCRALSDLSAIFGPTDSVWAIFASTSSRIADFAAPSIFHRSQRVAHKGHQLFPPFTLTNWDVFAPYIKDPACAALENVGRFSQLAGFGRPLWHGFKEAGNDGQRIARQKLIFEGAVPESFTAPQALAIMGQRFGLDVVFGHPESTEFLDTAVASHMRVCISVTRDMSWRKTTYPSEPVLSNAAASLLHTDDRRLQGCLTILNLKLRSGMIDKGQRGELVSRILLLLGCDATPPLPLALYDPDAYLKYCTPVKLLDFLATTFGNHFGDEAIQADFSTAYVNTSHWVFMEENLVRTGRKKRVDETFNPKSFLLRLWLRTAGVQCAHNQPGIDKIWSVYFDDGDALGLPEDRMSSLVFSDKLSDSDGTHSHQHLFPWNSGIQLHTGRPSVVVTCDMGSEAQEPVVTYKTLKSKKGKQARKCLKIHVKGTSRVSFPFMSEGVEKEIGLLTKDAMDDTTPYPVGVQLEKSYSKGRKEISPLVSTLFYGQNWGCKSRNTVDLLSTNQVKIRYTIAKLHPDKSSYLMLTLNANNLTIKQRIIAQGVFGTLNEAWNAGKS